MIDKNSPLPLYSQLQNIMVEKIKEGIYPQDKALPSEFELVDTYGVSRTTVRQAIDNLVKDGYLEKRRGVGTFVVDRKKRNLWDLQELKSFREEFISKGFVVRTEALNINCVKANKELNEVFGKDISECYCLERLRYINEKPVICVTTYVPKSIAPGLDIYNFSKESLFDILSTQYNVQIKYATKEFRAISATNNDAKLLNIEKNSPIQLVKTTTYNDKNIPIEYSISRDRGDISIYKVKVNYRNK